MTKIRQRMYLLAFAALVLLFAGCKGESPTSPTPTTGGGTGGVTPPTTASVTVTVSNATPLVDSTTVVTATVTVNNSPAANGTAVEFKTNLGTFTDANAPLTIRTTTGGVATATLTSSTAGTATVTATVANVAKTVQATFSLAPVKPPPPDTTVAITSITPTTGKPAGGDIVTITGKNFVSPVRILFDYGSGVTKEAQVVSVSATQIQVVSPPVDLGAGQTKDATIVLINNVGSPNEVRITGPKFTYQALVLTPKITTISPTSGPIDGGTRVTIFGESFQAPVQVFFGSAEAVVINVTFSQIIVMSPTARDTTPTGSGTLTGTVPVKVININSAKTSAESITFRYAPAMQITAISPTFGSAFGGTTVVIDGIGFNDPVTVDIASIRAQVLKVSGTQILARTAPTPSPCTPPSAGAVVVTNVDNGEQSKDSNLQTFTYVAVKPLVTSVTSGASPITEGSLLTITVQDPGIGQLGTAFGAVTTGSFTITPSTPISTASGPQTFSGLVPFGLTYPAGGAQNTCTFGGLSGTLTFGPLPLPVTFTNLTTTCSDTRIDAIIIQPPVASNTCNVPIAVAPACIPATVGSTPGTGAITLQNRSALTLTVSGVSVSGANASEFVVSPANATIAPKDLTTTFNVTFTPTSASPSARAATATFTTNLGPLVVSLCGTTAPQPPPLATLTTPSPSAGNILAAGTTTGTATITIKNGAATGGQNLTIGTPVISGVTNATTFTIAPTTGTASLAPGLVTSWTVTIDPAAVGPVTGTVTFTTNDPGNPTLTVTVTATGT